MLRTSPKPRPLSMKYLERALQTTDRVMRRELIKDAFAHHALEVRGMPTRTPGQQVITSIAYKGLAERGFPAGTPFSIDVKAVPSIGVGVVQPSRDVDFVRASERQPITLRDLVRVVPIDSGAVSFVSVDSYTRAAAPAPQGTAKQESTATLSGQMEPVKTIAVHMPVGNNTLQDSPAEVAAIIDDELIYDLIRTEEVQGLWGDGVGENLLGIFNTAGVSLGRTSGGDSITDLALRMMTDIRLAGYQPNAVMIDPLDFEAEFTTDDTNTPRARALTIDEDGNYRLWGMLVVQTPAMREPGTFTTNERRLLVGDFRRGATLWEREENTIRIGENLGVFPAASQFVKNQKTVLAETRVAFRAKRPAAFRYRVTQARVP